MLILRFTLPAGWGIRRLFAVGLSGLLHAMTITGLTFVRPFQIGEIEQKPRKVVQLLQLNFPEARPLPLTPPRATRAAREISRTTLNKGAPQTVKVADAQPDLVLQVPVPFAATQDFTKHKETPEVVNTLHRVSVPPEEPATYVPPPVGTNVLSLPEKAVVAETVVVIPRVDQTAGLEAQRVAQEKAAQEKAAQEKAAQEKAAQERAAQERAAQETAAQETAAQEKAAQQRAAQQRAAQERAAQEKTAQEKAAQENAVRVRAAQAKSDQDNSKLEGTTRIDFPRDGVFGMSLQGESLIRQHPEVESQSTAKLVSSVYLKVGLKKSWVLEFSPNEPNGNTEPIAPPWLYEIYRPDELQKGPEEGAVLVAGVINTNGLFENLQLLLPKDWPRKDPLLRALNHWKFRPASRKGEAIAIKILLVIPQLPELQ
jgi:hypothetical protein